MKPMNLSNYTFEIIITREQLCDDTFSPANWKTGSSRTGQQQLGEITR